MSRPFGRLRRMKRMCLWAWQQRAGGWPMTVLVVAMVAFQGLLSSWVFSGPPPEGLDADDATLDPVRVELEHPGPEADETTDSAEDTDEEPDSIWDSLTHSFKLGGHVRQETAYRIDDSGEWTKIRQQGLLTERGRLTDSLSFRATQRIVYDAVYDLTDNYDKGVERDQEFEAEIRETYLDYSRGPLDIRLGKQQIVWGEAVGLFIADVVNAKDFREYILRDFDLTRLPQWGVDVEWAADPFHAEFVWLPVLRFHHLPVSGSEFEFPLPVPEGVTPNFTDPSKPPSAFDNSEVGTRLSYLIGGWDLSAFYFYTWDKFPVLYRRIAGSSFIFTPEYRRAHIMGGSFSKDVNPVVLKGEWAVNPGTYLTTFDTRDPDGIVRRPVADYTLGVDYTAFDTIETNTQVIQRVVLNHPDLLQEDRLRTHVSFWAKTDVLGGKVEPEFLVIAGLSETDLLYRPSVTVNATDALQLTFGADIFQGHRAGLFGQFDDHSRIYTEVTYYF